MKSTGVVRTMDPIGRIVLPIELRRTLDITEGDSLEIFVDGNHVILRKYAPGCHFCSNVTELVPFLGKQICKKCIAKLRGSGYVGNPKDEIPT